MRKTNKNAPSFAPKKAFTKPTKKSSNKKKTNNKKQISKNYESRCTFGITMG